MAEKDAGQNTLEQQLADMRKERDDAVIKAKHLEKQLTQKANQVATLKSQSNDGARLAQLQGEIATLRQGLASVIKAVSLEQSPSTTEVQAMLQKLEAPVPAPTTPVTAVTGTDKPGAQPSDVEDVDPAYEELFKKAYDAGFSPQHPMLKKALYEDDGQTLRQPIDALTAFDSAMEANKAEDARIAAVQAEAAKKTTLPPSPPAGSVANAADWHEKPTSQKIRDGLSDAFERVTGGRRNTED